jgi:tetratricopeptide (TPR) repeat protein
MTPSGIALAFLTPLEPTFTTFLLLILVLAGVFVIFLRNLGHCPPDLRLRRKGLDALIAGRPGEAEKYFRKSMAMLDPSNCVRSLVCLADALMDQGRYEESHEYLVRALELGDPTGSGQGSMADLLLLTRTDPEGALDMAGRAVELSTRSSRRDIYFGGGVSDDLRRAKYWARSAQALAHLNRQVEARQAIDRALRIVEAAKAEAELVRPRNSIIVKLIIGDRRLARHRELAVATTHWRIALAFLAIDDSTKAADHFRITHDTDRRGKYRRLARQQLELLDLRR